jgi:pyruvate/2-oxoglutarate dehydrogenase complex dihydrolipoamide acyltransferase (E2) component
VTDTSAPAPEPAPPLPWRVRGARHAGGFLTPAVRRVAAERGIDVATLAARAGSGAEGRLTVGDIDGVAGTGLAGTGLAGTGAVATGDERVPFNRVQTRAGVALHASTQTAAHALTVVQCDYSAVDATRRVWR